MATSGVLCTMDNPVGKAIGNALEVKEAIRCLKGEGPTDLEELVVVEGALLLTSSKKFGDHQGNLVTFEQGKEEILATLKSGKALEKVSSISSMIHPFRLSLSSKCSCSFVTC